MQNRSPYLLLVLATLFWAGNFIIGRAIQAEIPPLTLSFWRLVTGFVFIMPFAYPYIKRDFPIILQNIKVLSLLTALGMVAFTACTYTALQSTTATNAVLLVSTSPVFIILFSFVMFKTKVTFYQLMGVVLSLLGVVMIVSRGEWEVLKNLHLNIGDMWVMIAVITWALYSVFLRWKPQGIHWLSLLGTMIALAVLMLFPLYLWESSGSRVWEINMTILSSLAYISLFPLIISYMCWNQAVQEIGANTAGHFLHLIPAFGVILSMIFLNERLASYHYLGILAIFSGIYIATIWKPKKLQVTA